MSQARSWREIAFNNSFESELTALERRRVHEPELKLEDLKGILKHLYQHQGADWSGRGELQDLNLAGTIAAYEHFIANWAKAEIDT